MRLFDDSGNRLYLTPAERERFRAATQSVSKKKRMFALMLYYTGCRISEVLSIKVKDIDFSSSTVTVKTLKQKRDDVYRQIPLPDSFLTALDNSYDLRIAQRRSKPRNEYVWGWSRQYGHSVIIGLMKEAKLSGAAAVPKGLRHGFAIACLDKGIQLNMVKKWMGHSSLTTTAIYANATGQEERNIAARLWE